MIKKILFLFIFLPFAVLSQNSQTLRQQAETYYNNGDFLKSYETYNKIKDKETLETTNVNLYKSHLENIMQYHFVKKTKLNDSLYKVYIKTSVLKSQGVYNEKSKKYTLAPVYDSIPFHERYFKYKSVYKNNKQAFVNIETGKVIIPLGYHSSEIYGDYVLTAENTRYDYFSYDTSISVFDLNGNLLFKDLNTFNTFYPNYISTKNTNNKYRVFDANTKKIIFDDIDQFFSPSGPTYENGIEYNNTWLPFRKNGQYYLYKIIANEFIDTHKFDNYIPLYYKNNYFDNAITSLINTKDNAPFVTDTIRKLSFFSYYTIVKKDNKYGIFNISKDKYYKEPVYDSINKLGNTFYNGKWINLIYDEEICEPESDRFEAIVFKKNSQFGLMNLSGKILVEASFDEIRYLSNGIFTLRKGQKWGFTGVQKGDAFIAPQFDYIDLLGGYFEIIACYKNKKITKFLRNGEKPDVKVQNDIKNKNYVSFEQSITITNINDYARVNDFDRSVFEKNGKFGLDDIYYKEVLPPTYSKIQFAKNNTFIASQGSKAGLIDRNGKEVIPVQYAKIEYKDPYSDVFFVTSDNGLQSIFNSKGIQLYPATIKEVTIEYFDFKTKTDYVFVTELSPETEMNNSGKKEKSYIKAALKIKDDKVEKLKGDSFEFVDSNYIRAHTYQGGKVVFYNVKNGKIIDDIRGFNIINDYANDRFFATRVNQFDTVVDSFGNETTLEYPLYEIKNDIYFFKDENKIGVMNKNLQATNFRYPVLKIFEGSSYFRFNSNTASKKDGIINFDGKIIIEPEIYDEIQLKYFPDMYKYQNSYFEQNQYLKQYNSDLFACTKYGKENKTVQIISSQKEIIATFEVKNNGNWNFSANNGAIIIRSTDSINVYDLKTKKIFWKIRANQFHDDKDFGYTAAYIDASATKNKYEKYDCNGQFIFDTIVDTKQQYSGSFNENYILKRNNKYGVVNSKGKAGIPFVYDSLESKNGKIFISKKDNVFGIINEDNQLVTDSKYDDIQTVEVKDLYAPTLTMFSAYKVREKNKFGLFDSTSKMILPPVFDNIKLYQSFIISKKDSLINVYDHKGNPFFSAVLDSVTVNSNYNSYRLYKNGKELYRDYNGVITDKNPYISWDDQLKMANSKETGGKYYLAKNDIILYKTPVVSFKQVEYNRDFIGEYFEHLLIQDENNLYGLYTKDLKQILPFQYEEITIQINEDYYVVKKGGRYGAVNSQNQIVIPFKYDSVYFNRGIFYCTNNKKTSHITPQTNL